MYYLYNIFHFQIVCGDLYKVSQPSVSRLIKVGWLFHSYGWLFQHDYFHPYISLGPTNCQVIQLFALQDNCVSITLKIKFS